LLQDAGGYYECPRDAAGRRAGPLVGYAGKYEDADCSLKNFVGDIYANWAAMEEHPRELEDIAYDIMSEVFRLVGEGGAPVFCGAPLGGLSLALLMAHISGCRYIFAEKKVTAVASETSREKSKLVFGRHEPNSGDKVVLVEDLLNNFSTTAELIDLVSKYGASVTCVAAIMDRSNRQPESLPAGNGTVIPVVALVRAYIPQYRQDDPAVAADIAAGNIVWKPKDEWSRLMEAMKNA
jgi:orotate phosphoribosyltransferase